MRLSDREAGQALGERLEPLGRTAFSIVYAEKGKPESVLKAAGLWLDGEMYDHAAFAEDPSNMFKREAAIYEARGSHPCILKCMGAELLPDGEEAWALRLERAPHGDLRRYFEDIRSPAMASRIRAATDLATELQHIHGRDVIWGDLSPRNILVFNELHIKLCDFAESSLGNKYPDILFGHESRNCVPGPANEVSPKSELAKELFALGTAICEITQWAVPYGLAREDEVQARQLAGEYAHVDEDNPVRHVIEEL